MKRLVLLSFLWLGSCSIFIGQALEDFCGDGRVTDTEVCDDGNLEDGDGCDANCTNTGCGNGIITVGEQCDDGCLVGTPNQCEPIDGGDGCDAQCQEEPVSCGNGIREGAEQCDDENLTSGDGCDANCTNTGCGNGIPTSGEECDDGNLINNDGCLATCVLAPVCGNGIVDAGEACDNRKFCVDGAPCLFGDDCLFGECASPINDDCSDFCTVESCGDGVLQPFFEECDDLIDVGCAGCFLDFPECGDGILELDLGEECDDGNLLDNDGCDSQCFLEVCFINPIEAAFAIQNATTINGSNIFNDCSGNAGFVSTLGKELIFIVSVPPNKTLSVELDFGNAIPAITPIVHIEEQNSCQSAATETLCADLVEFNLQPRIMKFASQTAIVGEAVVVVDSAFGTINTPFTLSILFQ